MSAPHKPFACLPSFCKKYHNWCKFDKVLIKNNFAQFFLETVHVCMYVCMYLCMDACMYVHLLFHFRITLAVKQSFATAIVCYFALK